MRWHLLAACVAAGIMAAPLAGLAQAPGQDLRGLSDQIERLRRDMDVLQRQLARSPGGVTSVSPSTAPNDPPQGFIAQTDARFGEVESQLRDLTGKLEQVTFQLGQVSTRLDKLVGDIDFRLSQLERSGAPTQTGAAPAPSAPVVAQAAQAAAPAPPAGTTSAQPRLVLVPGGPSPQTATTTATAPASPSTATPPAAPPAQFAALPSGTPEAQYNFAYGEVLKAQREQGDFARAEAALKAFIAANGNHRLAGNAQYWLGETYYVRRDYQSAATAFAAGFQRYPQSEKGPDNLLKLGLSLGQLNRKPEACGTLGELDRRYPQAAASIKQSATRERQRLACG
jgi:tol-pal system protein YbgF